MDNFKDILIAEGINAKGFGTISKIVMLDKRLTIQSKAIYSYFCAYAGGGSQPFQSVNKILGDLCIGEDTYYKHMIYLKAYGYILVNQRKNDKGVFLSNIYTLTSHPAPNLELVNRIESKRQSKKQVQKNITKQTDNNQSSELISKSIANVNIKM